MTSVSDSGRLPESPLPPCETIVSDPKPAPGPRGAWLLGSTLDFKDSPLEYARYLHRAYGDVVKFRVGHLDWYLLAHPDDIYDAMVTRADIFLKPAIASKLWEPFLGDGVLTLEGTEWKRASRLMRPAFHKKRLDTYAAAMTDCTAGLVGRYTAGERRDIAKDMTAVTLEIVGRTLFDVDVREEAGDFGEAMLDLQDAILDHLYLPLPIPKWWPSKTNKRKWAAIDHMRGLVADVIADRRRSGEDRGDLLSMLIEARDEDGQGLTDKELLDQSMTLFFAGHETTANSLAWNWYLLARHPEVTARLQADLDRVCGGAPMRVEHLRDLPYLDQVVKESMRVLPSVWTFMKEPTEDVVVRGYHIPKGSQIMFCPSITQRDERWWPNPTVFDPERFSPENEKQIRKGAYFPFSGGSRVCMGKAFAMMESKIILGTMLQRIEPSIPADFVPKMLPELSMHPKGGIPFDVVFRDRHESNAAK